MLPQTQFLQEQGLICSLPESVLSPFPLSLILKPTELNYGVTFDLAPNSSPLSNKLADRP